MKFLSSWEGGNGAGIASGQVSILLFDKNFLQRQCTEYTTCELLHDTTRTTQGGSKGHSHPLGHVIKNVQLIYNCKVLHIRCG